MRRSRWIRYALAVAFASVAGPVAVSADDETGGASVPATPSIEAVTCADGGASTCPGGATLTVSGADLGRVRAVVFLGRPGGADDRSARPTATTDEAVVVTVPTTAHTGPLALDAGRERVRAARVRVTPRAVEPPAVPLPPPAAQAVFPIAGEHTYGRSATTRFGGGRGHQGQDVFAECGTPLVAAGGGTVLTATFEANAGNYVVVQRADGRSNVYMHLRDPAAVTEGEEVAAGDALGVVGATGRASGCHLHFELWTAPGWYRGGRPIDPLSTLRRWDAAEGATPRPPSTATGRAPGAGGG